MPLNTLLDKYSQEDFDETIDIYQKIEDILNRTEIALGEGNTVYTTSFSDTKEIIIDNDAIKSRENKI